MGFKTIFSFLLLFCCSIFSIQAQVYVDQNATGNNDGTSWADAYTDLSTPLAQIAGGEIWVAAGTYLPGSGSPDSTSSFRIASSISLYGGFNGTETMFSQRDVQQNLTILSGDINGDDIPGDFETNRSDNVQHVIFVDAMLIGNTIDGFTIRNGHTSTNDDLPETNWRGAGIFSYSLTVVRNCRFENNFGLAGAGIYFSPNGGGTGCNGSIVESCVFESNYAANQSAGIFANSVNGLEVIKCEFIENTTNRGAFYPLLCDNVLMDSCRFDQNEGLNDEVFGGAIFSFQTTNMSILNTSFTKNIAGNAGAIYFDARDIVGDANLLIDNCEFRENALVEGGFGGALYNWQGVGLRIQNSTFVGNVAGNGVAMYHDGREVVANSENLIFDNCDFRNNVANGFGGGMLYAFTSSFEMENCSGFNNSGANGSHLYVQGDDQEVVVRNSIFEAGSATFGGVMNCYGARTNFTLDGNAYVDNEASSQGGALVIGFQANANISNCTFMGNDANFGGAVRIQNDSTFVSFENCKFESNSAIEFGGAVYQGGGIKGSYDRCTFFINSAGTEAGALALYTFNDDQEQGTADITNCKFNLNIAPDGGGAIQLIDVPTLVSNCLISDNLSTGEDGVGAGIYVEVTDSNAANLNVINSTIANNLGTTASGIGILRGSNDLTTMEVNFQNNIFSNIGPNIGLVQGEPVVLSNGGNIANDGGSNFLNASMDQLNVLDFMFMDAEDYDYRLLENSPAIDAGVAANAPLTDIDGKPRVGAPDVGAYEYDPTSAINFVEHNTSLVILPNPVKDVFDYQLEHDYVGTIDFYLFDEAGKLTQSWQSHKGSKTYKATRHIGALAAGTYYLHLRFGDFGASATVIKI